MGLDEEVYNLKSFIQPRRALLTNGSLVEFSEIEVSERTVIISNMAQRISKYKKDGILNGIFFEQTGTKFFQLIKTVDGWKIVSVIWEDDN